MQFGLIFNKTYCLLYVKHCFQDLLVLAPVLLWGRYIIVLIFTDEESEAHRVTDPGSHISKWQVGKRTEACGSVTQACDQCKCSGQSCDDEYQKSSEKEDSVPS